MRAVRQQHVWNRGFYFPQKSQSQCGGQLDAESITHDKRFYSVMVKILERRQASPMD